MPNLRFFSLTVALLGFLPLGAHADTPTPVVVIVEAEGLPMDASTLRARIGSAANVQVLSLLDERAATASRTLCLVVTAGRVLLELRGARGLHVRRDLNRPSGQANPRWIADAAAELLQEAPTDGWTVTSEVIDPFLDLARRPSIITARTSEVIDPWRHGARGHPSEQGVRLDSPAPRSRRAPRAPRR